MSDVKKRAHVARLLTENDGRVWVFFDEEHTMRGEDGESQEALLARWRKDHGKVDVLVRIDGVCRPSELAMQIAELQRQRKKTTRRTCSWCHTVNDVTAGPTLCKECGHRADISRLACDCRQCCPQEGAS